MFSFLYLPILLMLFKCILLCECICLLLSLLVVCLFFDTIIFNFSNVLQVYLNLRVYLFVFVFVVKVLFIFFFFLIVFVSFSNVHWFSVKVKVSDWVERDFFSLPVFGGNLLRGDIQPSMTKDRQHLSTLLRPTAVFWVPYSWIFYFIFVCQGLKSTKVKKCFFFCVPPINWPYN